LARRQICLCGVGHIQDMMLLVKQTRTPGFIGLSAVPEGRHLKMRASSDFSRH
jgi:hypothetical protein